MSNELTPIQTFQERITEKIRKDIGELLPEEAIKALFDKAIADTFFTPKDGYGREQPSWFTREIIKVAEPILNKAVAEYVESHKEVIQAAISQYLTGQNITLLTVAAMGRVTQDQIWSIASEIMNQMNIRR